MSGPGDSEPHPAARPDEPRQIGRFAVVGRLGAGAMGVVYAAYDPQLDRKVAVKLLARREGDASARWQHRLLREAQALAKLSHPNVVQIHEVGFHGDEVFVAMEFVTGVDLRTWLNAAPRSWRDVVAVFVQAGRGLAAAHAAGLVHRDVKPDNFLVGDDGRVRVVDFGLVRFGGDDEATGLRSAELAALASVATPTRTAPGLLVGTPAYMSPEQYRGRPADPLSDQFSFCVTLYEALYGERPFYGANARELSKSVLSGQIAQRQARDVPAWLVRAVLRGLAPEPAARFADMNALLGELSRDHGRVRRGLAWTGVALLVGCALFAGVLAINSYRARNARERAEELADQRLRAAEATIDALLADGRRAEADEVFDAFVAVPEHRGTRALARALRGWGERAARSGDLAAARTAFARAFAAAEEPTAERAIVRELARLFHRQWSWDQLAALCAAGPGDPALAAPCAEAAFARRDFAGVAAAAELRRRSGAALPPDLEDMVQVAGVWQTALASDRVADAAGAVDLDGDGTDELYLYAQNPAPGRLDVVRADRTLALLRRYSPPGRLADRPGIRPLSLRPGEPAVLFTWDRARRHVALSSAGSERLEELVSFAADEPLAAAAADLDRDGARELYLGTGPYGRQLLALHRLSDGTWRIDHPHPPTDATNSDINALVAADLDGDGRDELAVSAGPWRAFDVRVLRQGPAGLELVARRKLGAVSALTTLRAASGELLLVAAKSDAYPSKVAFSPDAPAGPEAGLYFLRLSGKTLSAARFVAAPRREPGDARSPHPDERPADLVRVFAGDIDGDGLDDLVARAHLAAPGPPLTIVYRQRRDGSFAALPIAGLIPLALIDLDGDPAKELVARAAGPGESTLWILGAGEDTIPPLPPIRSPEATAAPELADPLLARTWRRAEQLAALGLSSEAADALDDLAGLLAEAPAREAARRRSAELHEAAGDFLTAAARYEEVAGAADTAALQGAARCYEQASRFADALRVTRALAQRDDLPRAEAERVHARLAELTAVVDDVTTTPLRFDAPLQPAWQIDDPTSARHDLAGQRLQLEAFAGQAPIARLPLEWSHGPLGVRADLSLQRAEWGSGVTVGLRPAASPGLVYSVGVEVLGGGGLYSRRHVCQIGGRDSEVLFEEPGDDPARPGAAALSIELLPELGVVLCRAEVGGAVHERRLPLPVDALPPPGRYELVVAPRAFGEPTGLWTQAALHSITVRGARPADPTAAPPSEGAADDPSPSEPRVHAARYLSEGEAEAALEQLSRMPDADPVASIWRAVALSELGRWTEASEVLRQTDLAASPAARGAILRLLRARRQTIAPLVRSAFGPAAYFRMFWDGLERTASHHGDPQIERALTTALTDLEEWTPARGDTAGHVLKVRLMFERGRAWSRLAHQTRARADLAAAAALAEQLPPDQRDLYDLHYERAALEAAAGDREAALEHAHKALRAAPTRELAADRIRFDPRFAKVHEDEEWQALSAE